MKKVLLTAVFAALGFCGFSQLVELDGQQNLFTGSVEGEAEIHINWTVINASANSIDFGCKKIGLQEVAGSTNQFCWGFLCTAFGTGEVVSSEIVTLGEGDYSNTFYANYRHNGNAGQSVIRYCWFDSNDETNSFCYDVTYCVDALCTVSIAEQHGKKAEIVEVSPNPIEKTGHISYSFASTPQAGRMHIYNMVGTLVKTIDLQSKEGVVVISASDFESGIYFCSIEDEGHVSETTRLVITR